MLEFNKNHNKAKGLKDAFKNRSFKEILIMTAGGLVMAVCLATLLMPGQVLPILGVNIEPQYVNHQVQEMIQKSELRDNPEVVLGAQKIDYYESINPTMKQMQDSGVLEGYVPSNNGEPATFDEFKSSVERTNLNVDYMSENGRYISFSKEEMENFKEELFGDYNTINEYLAANQNQDYNRLYTAILNYRVKEALEQNGIEDFKLNGITINEEDPHNKYANLNLTVNGENTNILAGGYIFDILKSMNNESKADYIDNINKLASGDFSINMDTHEINNYTEAKKETDGIARGLSAALLVTVLGSALGVRKNDEDERTIGKS